MIVVDTSVLIEIFDKKSAIGEKAMEKIFQSGEEVAITVINLHEILYGLQKYAKPVKEILRLPVLSFTKRDAITAARIELEAEKKGLTVRRTDAMIAAICIDNGAILYTLDLKHFKPLEPLGLKLLQ
jgi:tRNA(fMet)-specific endonuclease VapC